MLFMVKIVSAFLPKGFGFNFMLRFRSLLKTRFALINILHNRPCNLFLRRNTRVGGVIR